MLRHIGGNERARSIVGDAMKAQQESIVASVVRRRSVLISGQTGTGRSTLFRAVTSVLTHTDMPIIDVAHQESRDAITHSGLAATLAYDGLEQACPQILHVLHEHHDAGGAMILTLNSSRSHTALPRACEALLNDLRSHAHMQDGLHEVHLDPVADAHIAKVIHSLSTETLDSAMADTITRLAFGRPAWAVDLLELAQSGHLVSAPHPRLAKVPLEKARVPALRRLMSQFKDLPEAVKAAAIGLSQIDPLDTRGMAALVGHDVVEQLTNVGALVPYPESNAGTVTVPEFIAAAVHLSVPRECAHLAGQKISDRLLRQEALGIPLSERDTSFCATTLEATGMDHAPTPEQNAVLLRTAANHIAFGAHAQARSLLLSFSSIGEQLGPLTHARMLAVLGNPNAAAEALESPDLRTNADTFVASRFLHSTLAAEIHGEPDFDNARDGAEENPNGGLDDEEHGSSFDSAHSDALLTFRLWNSRGSLALHLPQLQRIADTHTDRRVSYFAGALVDLEAIWHGKLPSPSSWLRSGRRVPTMHGVSELERDLASTLLGAHALILLMTGESVARQDELYDAAHALPAPSAHARWLRHLLASGFAVTYGDIERALVEWELLRTRAPRFFPMRLRHYLATISEALAASIGESSPAPDIAESLAYRYALFFTGKHRALQHVRRDPATDGETLPLIRLANDQLNASQFRNPVALQRIADRFTEYEMWLPAAYALIEARRIYMSRRATGRVIECDQALETIWREALAHAPWFSGQRDVLQTPEQLTSRELETAQLAAEGKSNRQIAEILGCKVRTVESHLAQARAKIGASSRQEIAEILARLRL